MDARTIYLQFNNGPVQAFRVWDAERFVNAQMERGRAPEKKEDRFTVTVKTETDYKAERKR